MVSKNMHKITTGLILAASVSLAGTARADPPRIVDVQTSSYGGETRFDVTLAHPDTGWDHYADGWRVLDMDGNELGLRVLFHPHVDEQPFTRSLGGIKIPAGVKQVQIQSRCLVDGWSTETLTVELK